MRRAHLLTSLLLATLGLAASAEVLDLGVFKPVKPRPETGVTDYHYWKDGRTILVEALRDEKEVARLELSWPGDMTAHVRCTTPAGRDVTMVMLMKEGKFQFTDHQNGKQVELRFDATQRAWQAMGTDGSAEEFAAEEMKLIQIIAKSYEDALANLNLGPLAQTSSEPSPNPSEGETAAATVCAQWPVCDGPIAVESALGFSANSCCESATAVGNTYCVLVGNSRCTRCCLGTCYTLCVAGDALCSCTFEGRACGSIYNAPCHEEPWPPECT